MTNPINKKTKEQFVNEIPKELKIEIIGDYINTDTKIEYKCEHGIQSSLPWQIKKMKFCCRSSYYSSGKMWASTIVSSNERLNWYKNQRPTLNFDKVSLVNSKRNEFDNISCQIHPNILFKGKSTKQHCTPCPECKRLHNLEKILAAGPKAWASESTGSFVSKQETKWLDELGIIGRQVWLENVKYKVDGYDPISKTVYLYHGRFWHGCPETYNPEMIHPIIKVPMKDLYEKTMYYENKIQEAGYNLIVKWGT
jgi:hypothetical protein